MQRMVASPTRIAPQQQLHTNFSLAAGKERAATAAPIVGHLPNPGTVPIFATGHHRTAMTPAKNGAVPRAPAGRPHRFVRGIAFAIAVKPL
jgi:hypothetical protein